MSVFEKPRLFNLSEIKDIPILEVCTFLGITTQKKGRNHWCKLRDERSASTILHTENNTFYDFGTQQGGSNIDLYCTMTGASISEAITELGNAFHLQPESYEERKKQFRTMSRSDYARIGLYYDLATKNFTFDIEHLSLDQLVAIERKYRMNMNELRKEHPGVYSRVIREKAVPYVTQLRNQYYLKAWNRYTLLRSAGCSYQFFRSDETLPRFEQQKRRLEQAEWSLHKACIDTDISLPWMATPDPIRVVSRILQGNLTISVGERSYEEMSRLSHKNKDKPVSLLLDQDAFFDFSYKDAFGEIPYAAEMNATTVRLWILSRDIPLLKKTLGPRWADFKPESLSYLIESAQMTQKSQAKSEKETKSKEPTR